MQHLRWEKCWDWVRLIDDTLSGWESEEILLHPGIKWTCEKEKHGRLPIFDIQLIRKEEVISTTVYRKSSASDRYIHYTSWQAWKEKAGAILTLKNRAYTYYLLKSYRTYLKFLCKMGIRKRLSIGYYMMRRNQLKCINRATRKQILQMFFTYHIITGPRDCTRFCKNNLGLQRYSRKRVLWGT